MKKHLVRAAFTAGLLCATAGIGVFIPSSATLADDTNKVSRSVAVPLAEAQKLMQGNDFQGALAKIKDAQAAPDRTPYDDYKINQFLGYVSIKMNDHATALIAFEAMADSPALQPEDMKDTLHNALLLAGEAKLYDKVIAYGLKLGALNALDDQTTADMALAYYNTNDVQHAAQYAQQSINLAKAAGKPPNETALQLVMSSEAKQNNQAGAEEALEQLAVANGGADNWSKLVGVALSVRGIRDLDALFLYRLLYVAGAMGEPDDFTLMGDLAYQLGYPTEAVNTFQQGIMGGKISAGQAGEAYRKAKNDSATDEKELGEIATAAEHSKTGEQDAKLAEDYWGYGRFADAETAIRRAIGKDGMKIPSEGDTLLGMVLVEEGKYDEAIQILSQVKGTEGDVKTAHLWSLYAQWKKSTQTQAAAPAAQPAPADQTPGH